MKSVAISVYDFLRSRYLVLLTGLAIGLLGAWLVSVGNYPNAGLAPTCFICGTAGALGLQSAVGFQQTSWSLSLPGKDVAPDRYNESTDCMNYPVVKGFAAFIQCPG